MYRSYENPHSLEDQLKEMQAEFQRRYESGEDLEDLIDISISIEDLKQRINFAWQDDEYDSENYSGDYED